MQVSHEHTSESSYDNQQEQIAM